VKSTLEFSPLPQRQPFCMAVLPFPFGISIGKPVWLKNLPCVTATPYPRVQNRVKGD